MPEYVALDEETIDLREYWQALVRRKWLVIVIFMVAVITAAIFSFMATPIYEATTSIMVQTDGAAAQLAFLEALGGAPPKNQNQNYVEILKSRTVAERTARKLGLDDDVYSSEFAAFRGSISVQLVTGTDAIRVKVQHKDPKQAALVANTVVDTFMEMNQEVNTEEARSARTFVAEQLKLVEADLRQAEEELRRYKEQEKVVAPSEEAKAVIAKVTELEKQKAESTVALKQIDQQLGTLRTKLQAEAPTTITATTISNNPMVAQYRTHLFQLEQQLSALQAQYTPDHPRIAALNAEIQQVRTKLNDEVERIVSAETRSVNPNYQSILQQIVSLEVEKVAQQAREQALTKLIGEAEKSLTSLPSKELRLTQLVRNQSVLEQMYLLLKNKHEEYRISEAVKAAGVSVIDRAIPPKSPIKPNKKLNVAIAGFLGLFVGVGLVLLLEFMDTTIKTAEDVERYLGLPVLGRIPEASGDSQRTSSHRRHRVRPVIG